MAQLSSQQIQRARHLGVLCALSMVLGYLESFVPIPIPGLKLGLANIPVLSALARKDVRGAWCIGLVKVLASGLLFGTPVSMAYSAAGTLLALLTMSPLSRLKTLRLEMVSATGALAHEMGQLLVAQAMLGTNLVWYSAPLLLTAGVVTGILCGIAARRLNQAPDEPDEQDGKARDVSPKPAKDGLAFAREPGLPVAARHPAGALLVFTLYVALTFRAQELVVLGALLALALAACALARVRLPQLARALRPVAAIALITLVAQVATTQHAEPLFVVGPIVVAKEAVRLAAFSCARLVAVSAAALAWTHALGQEGLKACVALALRPLERAGLSTGGFALTLNTALACLPALISNLGEVRAGRPHGFMEQLDQLVAQAYAAANNVST